MKKLHTESPNLPATEHRLRIEQISCEISESDGYFEEPILESSYPTIPIPELETLSACQYLLNSAQENVELGRTKWLTNSITGETLYFTDVEPLSRSVASAMYKRGMRKGDVVLYMTSDVTRIYAFTVGVWRCGGIMYSSYSEDTSDTLLSRIQDAHVQWIVCDPISVPNAKAAAKGAEWPVELIVFGDEEGCTDISTLFSDSGSDCPEDVLSEADLDDPLLILCTSGTTGKSKGAVYTNLQVLAFTIGTQIFPSTKPQPCSSSDAPMFLDCCSQFATSKLESGRC
ncbi:4-coumarate--CoA ligase 1 [Orchesella cincta]|uniref:4-coumarate--CoA ligase 1 n=1 Tax=Orchesella cincta TaxID=48709 RepID=A0A1D2MBF9_ORCCI|nr:4-coumarate--CoA ligase 1 [Orchesella cincta]